MNTEQLLAALYWMKNEHGTCPTGVILSAEDYEVLYKEVGALRCYSYPFELIGPEGPVFIYKETKP